MLTTKDLMALNELMTFENWIAIKMKQYSTLSTDKTIKSMFKTMATTHSANHLKLLNCLKTNEGEGGSK